MKPCALERLNAGKPYEKPDLITSILITDMAILHKVTFLYQLKGAAPVSGGEAGEAGMYVYVCFMVRGEEVR